MKIQQKYIDILKKGGIGVMPTDTIYGLLGSALKEKTVERIYRVRKREKTKPFIILISQISDLIIFGVRLATFQKNLLKKFWPGKVSLIFDCPLKKFQYLHRGKKSLAFRLPKPRWLRRVLKITGPLVAPSANLAGEKPATTIEEAKKYFGKKVDFYCDGGKIEGKPSAIIDIRKKKIKIIRK